MKHASVSRALYPQLLCLMMATVGGCRIMIQHVITKFQPQIVVLKHSWLQMEELLCRCAHLSVVPQVLLQPA